MQFIKLHLISIACGVVGLAAVVAAVMGMTNDAVKVEMQKRIGEAGVINRLKADPKNDAIIAAERERVKQFEQEVAATLEEAKRLNRRTPLMEGVFPRPATISTPFQLQEQYRKAIAALPVRLDAGDVPNELEIREELDNVNELREREKEQEQEGGGTEPAIQLGQEQSSYPPAQPSAPMAPMGGARTRGYGQGMPGGGVQGLPSQITTDTSGEPKYNPTYRACVSKAKSIRCYANAQSFHESPIATADFAPPVTEMWFAQVSLWIQQDVVEALAALNDEAAQQSAEEEPYVEMMPVKRLESIRVLGYRLRGGFLPFRANEQGNTGTLTTPASFTGRVSDEDFDVVPFVLTLVVDQRDLLRVIDRVTRQNFYQCVSCEYGPAPEEAGYMYGTEPAVRAVLGFEAYMSREVYQEWMPPEVLETLTGGKEK